MKHIFVINPKAGRVDRTPEISAKLHSYDGKIDYEIYVTKSLGDAQGYVREYLKSHANAIGTGGGKSKDGPSEHRDQKSD